jgi:hypothetical protein
MEYFLKEHYFYPALYLPAFFKGFLKGKKKRQNVPLMIAIYTKAKTVSIPSVASMCECTTKF